MRGPHLAIHIYYGTKLFMFDCQRHDGIALLTLIQWSQSVQIVQN